MSTDRRGFAAGMATLVLVTTALTAANAGDAHSATGPVTSGNGWKLQAPNITHIDSRPWAIAFHDTTSRNRLAGYAKSAAAELSSYLGVKITVTPIIVPVTKGKCPPSHIISLRWMSKPDPTHPTRSFSGACGNGTGAAYSAYSFINADYWKPGSGIPEWLRMNVIWHEMGHTVGLNHPDTCPTDKYGRRPLMCADTYKDLRLRRYTPYDAAGLRALVTNRTYYPTTAVN